MSKESGEQSKKRGLSRVAISCAGLLRKLRKVGNDCIAYARFARFRHSALYCVYESASSEEVTRGSWRAEKAKDERAQSLLSKQ